MFLFQDPATSFAPLYLKETSSIVPFNFTPFSEVPEIQRFQPMIFFPEQGNKHALCIALLKYYD
jgi:hypothetical protein